VAADEGLRVSGSVTIPESELDFTAIRSQGAGGQNVNKVASPGQLRFDAARSSALPPSARERLLALRDHRISGDGVVVIKAQQFRSQEQNKAAALERYKAERDRVLRAQVQPIEGVREVLEWLTIPYCIASSGDHDKMRITLGATRLLPLFEGRLFSAVDVPRGKPAPDVFLLAAERMGIAPARAVVNEDSVTGVLAGCAAGMTVLGFAGLSATEKLVEAGASCTFTHMRELPALLA
jgi:HAD superfamily hydrolase (TIGR01509 family)